MHFLFLGGAAEKAGRLLRIGKKRKRKQKMDAGKIKWRRRKKEEGGRMETN